MATLSTPAPKALPLFPVLLVNFIGMLGYSIVIPLLVFLVQRFGGNEVIYGLLGAIYPSFQLVGAPLLGRWSDSVGRKRVLMLSQIGTFLAWVLFIVALILPAKSLYEIDSPLLGSFFISIPLLLLMGARALDGLTGGNVSVANAYLSDISNDENRKANFGKMASSTSLGFVLGPMLASILGGTSMGEMLPVIASAGISLVAILVIYFFLPESHNCHSVSEESQPSKLAKLYQIEHKECFEFSQKEDSRSLGHILQIPGIPLMFGIYFLTFLGFSFFYSGFPIYAVQALKWETAQLGLFFTISSGVMIVIQGPVLTWLSSRVKDRILVTLGGLLIGISFLLIPMTDPLWVYGCVVVLAIGNGLMWPSFMAILGGMGGDDIKGTIMGYGNSMGSAASILGLIAGGFLFSYFDSKVFYIAGSIMLLIFFFSFFLKEK